MQRGLLSIGRPAFHHSDGLEFHSRVFCFAIPRQVHYAYEDDRGRKSDILYFWQGKASSTDEKACSALLTKDMDDAMGGAPTQVRVTQGKEPAHFCSIFDAHMIVHSGGKGSSFKNREEKDSYDVDGVSLYHIKTHYFYSHPTINPHRIIAKGPKIDFTTPHGRG